MLFIINSLLQLVQTSRANIDMHNFTNCSILSYSVSTFKLNNSVPNMKNDDSDVDDDVEQDIF